MLFLQVLLPKAVWSLCPLLCSTWWTQGSKGGNTMVNLSNHGAASWSEREPKIPPCISPCSLVFCPLHASHWCYHLSCSLSLLPAFTLTLRALSSSFYKFSQPNPLRFFQHERSLCIKMDMNLKVEREEATNSEHFWTLNPPKKKDWSTLPSSLLQRYDPSRLIDTLHHALKGASNPSNAPFQHLRWWEKRQSSVSAIQHH